MYLGIDLGTSGVRACILDASLTPIGFASQPYPQINQQHPTGHHEQNPQDWWETLCHCLTKLPQALVQQIQHIGVDGTSGTIVACDTQGQPLHPALMYNDVRATHEARTLSKIAPNSSPARGASSGLAKMLWLKKHLTEPPSRFLHQADWIIGKLTGHYGFSDYHNALKSGYDVISLLWPHWIWETGIERQQLPNVKPPGRQLTTINATISQLTGLPSNAAIHAGTTDSIAAFLATGAVNVGDAVTSLGSTLVIKVISDTPLSAPEYGIYSHRLGKYWLVGGASNSGGAALLQHFTTEEILHLSADMDESESGQSYYPLVSTGERFPIADPDMASRVTPRPKDRQQFLKGLLEGIATIEAKGYQKLVDLGAPDASRIFTSGGGSHNQSWTKIRQRRLSCKIEQAANCDAACGAAKLASYF